MPRGRSEANPTWVVTEANISGSDKLKLGPIHLVVPRASTRVLLDAQTDASAKPHPPTQVQAINDALVVASTLLNQPRAAAVEKGLIKAGM
jgi:hypothetical protein